MGSCIFGKYNVCTVTDVGHYVYDRSKRWLLNIQRCDIEKLLWSIGGKTSMSVKTTSPYILS